MATKVMYTLKEDKKELQKQFGCMNGIFQLFDRRYLLGLHRHGRNQKMLTPGDGENKIKNSTEKVKEKKNTKGVIIEKNRVSVESSRNSCSSSCSSTTFSSLDCSKRVQTELHLLPSLPTSPKLQKNQPEFSLPDIRDVVKDSMTRTIRVAKVKNVQKELKHVDSPRPFVRQKSLEVDRRDRNLAKEASRFSCDERESKYSLKSSLKVKEVPRLSLDSKQNSKNTPEPGSNKRPSSGVVARLMGLELEGFQDSIVEVDTLKNNPSLEGPVKGKNVKSGSVSVYGEMEKRLGVIEFKTSGKDLRALKQILEAIKNKEQSLDSPKVDKPVLTVTREVKPAKLTKVNHGEKRNDLLGRKKVKDLTPRKKKVNSGTTRLVTCPNSPEKLTGEKPGLKKSTKGSTDLSRTKKQSKTKTKTSKTKSFKESCIEARNDKSKEDHKDNFVERLEVTIEQPSPVSVLDAFYTEDTPSPINNKQTAFNDYETLDFDESRESGWNEVGIYSDDYLNTTNEDHKYINQILLTSGFLKDLEFSIRMIQIQPTGSLIKPDLFHFLEKKEYNEDKKNQRLKRKLIFDFVNDILLQKLSVLGSHGLSGRKRGRVLNGERVLKELCLEMDNVQNAPERCACDEDDEVKNLVSVDVNKKSEDWDEFCCEIPGVVLDIERLIFKDLIDEVVNADVASLQIRTGGRCRRSFRM